MPNKAFDSVDHYKLWKILKEMGIPDHLTFLLKICMQVKKQQLELDMEQQTGSKSGKEYVKAVYCHPTYLTYAEHIMRNAGLDETQGGIKYAGRNSNNLRYADDTTLMAENEELKSLLMTVKVKSLCRVRLFVTPWTVAYQAPPSMGFSRQEYWSGLPFPSPGIFPTQRSNPGLPHCRQKLYHLSHKVKEESKKISLKLNIQKTKIMASSPITSWQIYRETVETVRDFIFAGSKITAGGDYMKLKDACSLEEKLWPI